jgi:hypothetical protein
MKLSDDQNFDTELLMRTNKIGFVREASYFYRRYGGGVSQTRNNPYYCFEDIIFSKSWYGWKKVLHHFGVA